MTGRGRRRFLAVSALLAGWLVAGPALTAQASERDANFADQRIVELTRDGAVKGRGQVVTHLVAARTVTATNLAEAVATCDGCHATAISFQIVVAHSGPKSLNLGNVAYAENSSCRDCTATALAYQFVLATDSRARFTPEGKRTLEALDEAVRQLARSGRPPMEMQSIADGYAAQVIAVLTDELRYRPIVHRDRDCRT